jgi:sugar fermentation stimulation protein A
MKGSYFILTRLDESRNIKTESKYFRLSPGHYVYVGSAMGGLNARIKRHLSRHKTMKWHIDYLLRETSNTKPFLFPSRKKLECQLSQTLGQMADASVNGFGCSDCKCDSHLYYFRRDPTSELERMEKDWKT